MHRVFRVRPLVVTEANNLLLDRFGWQAVRPLLDEVPFLFQAIDPELRSSHLGRASGSVDRQAIRVMLRHEASRRSVISRRCAEILHFVQDDTGALTFHPAWLTHINRYTMPFHATPR